MLNKPERTILHEPSVLREQFDDLQQQLETSSLGMWTFLATELMFFGGLFIGFTVYRIRYLPGFMEGAEHLKMVLGAINTAVLLTSSLTVACSVWAAQHGRNKTLLWLLIATVFLGIIFLCIKGTEYYLENKEGLVPGFHFIGHGEHTDQIRLFMCFYFIMTGIHALHMLIGLVIFLTLIVLTWRGHFSPQYYFPIDVCGLYWHFVDLIWIFLFPTLYLLHH